MTDDDGSESASSGDQASSEVVLPAHASAYFSPRPPPALTQHRTIETEAVQFDPAVDPDLAQTRRMTPKPSEPPTWPDIERPAANSPTVLVPIVRARRIRRRFVAGLAAALLGGGGGVIFGLLDSPVPRAPDASAAPIEAARVGTPSTPKHEDESARLAAQPAAAPPAVSETTLAETKSRNQAGAAAEAPEHEATASATSSSSSRAGGAKAPAPKSSAWIKSEPPHAWIR